MPHGPGTTPVDHAFRKDDRHDPEARTRTRPWRLDPGRWFRARSRAGASYPVDGAHSLRSGGAVRLRAAGGHVLLRGGDLGGGRSEERRVGKEGRYRGRREEEEEEGTIGFM